MLNLKVSFDKKSRLFGFQKELLIEAELSPANGSKVDLSSFTEALLKNVPDAVHGKRLLTGIAGAETKIEPLINLRGRAAETFAKVPFTWESIVFIGPYALLLAAIGLIESLMTLN